MKLLCIGIDGLGYDVWKEHQLQGDRFTTRMLFSPVPVSGPAWTSIYTGMSVKSHNVRETWGLAADGCSTHGDIRNKCIWNAATRQKLTCNIVNMPITYPASLTNKFLSGFPQLGEQYAAGVEPPKNWREMDAIQWDVVDSAEWPGWMGRLSGMPEKEVKTRLRSNIGSVVNSFYGDYNLGMVGFTFVDRLLHLHPTEENIYWCAVQANELISRLLVRELPDACLVFSDHGFDTKGHNNRGVLAALGVGFEMAQAGWYCQHVAPLIASILGIEFDPDSEMDEVTEYEQMKDKLRAIGYIE